ncbi:hypothetical protein SAMN05661012_00712 [Chitinophaga sancti]|uniref:Uncharacterized protein n=1 Tax=Chitinophaga sancti TaxID=1004 RepID=A0A1K1MMN1_9BACT|nr:hypothetical protein SAMN05661012_00712 [Chitinophaga sancti]
MGFCEKYRKAGRKIRNMTSLFMILLVILYNFSLGSYNETFIFARNRILLKVLVILPPVRELPHFEL